MTIRGPIESVVKNGLPGVDWKEYPAPTIMGSLIQFLLSALETNLESKAKALRPQTLSLIFLLNNYSYIKKNMQVDDMTKLVGSGLITRYERLIAKCKMDYFTARYYLKFVFVFYFLVGIQCNLFLMSMKQINV